MKANKITIWLSLSIICMIIISQFASPAIVAAAITSAQTTNLTFTTVADTYVVQDQPDTNFGTNPSLRVDNTPIMRSYLRFTVSGLNGGTIQSVKLRLYANSAGDAGYSVYAVSDNNWNENTMTFNNSPAAGVHINNSQPFLSGVWTEVDISSYIKAEGTYTLLLTTSSDTTTKLASKDSGNNVPHLVVSTISQAPTNTPTATNVPPTATSVPPTATSVPPTATSVPATATSVPSTATTNLTFTTVADTYVVQDQPDTNFGTNPSLRVDNTPLMRSYLRFTVSGLNGATIKSAKLRLYANSASDVGYSVYAVSDNNWDEHTMTFNNSNQVTFNNSPASGIHITNSQPFLSDVWTEVDISGYVKSEGTYTLLLTTSSDTTTRLASRDSGNNAPQLVVSTISQALANTPTATSIAPTATSIAPTATSVAPTATSVAPTATSVAPTATSVAPTATKIPPTATPANTPISGTVWYVNNTATGNNTGTSWNNAWKSFADVNFSTIGSGATLYISGGTTSKTYTGTLNVPPGTTSVTITKGVDAGHNGEVIFDGKGSTQRGIDINAVGTPVKNLLISNLTIRNYAWAGVYGSGQNSGGLQGITVDNCKFLDFNRAGVFFQGNNNINNNYNIVVKNSYFDDNNAGTSQSDGIYVQVLKDFTADRNYIILDNNYTEGNLHSDNIQSFWVDNVTYSNNVLVQVSNKTLGTQMLFTENGHGEHVFLNNILIKNMPYASDSAMRLKSGSGSTFTAKIIGNSYYGMGPILNSSVVSVIKNNILYGISQPSTSIPFYRTLSGSDVSHNIFYDPNNKFPSSSGGVEINPRFVSTDFNGIDLRLQSNSPAIDAGVNLGSKYYMDIEGKSRGDVWNIGAYE